MTSIAKLGKPGDPARHRYIEEKHVNLGVIVVVLGREFRSFTLGSRRDVLGTGYASLFGVRCSLLLLDGRGGVA